MFNAWYSLRGISRELFEGWKDVLREDILWWEDESGDVHMRINLNVFQAIKMRKDIRAFNEMHDITKLELVKL